MTYGFLIDANNCIGCRTCAVACKDANSYKLGVGFRKVKAFTTGEYPEIRRYNVSYTDANPCVSPKTGAEVRCDFCADIRAEGDQPACVAACLMRAIEWGDLDELRAKHAGKRIESAFPSIDSLGQSQDYCLYILKDCMLEENFEEMII